MKLYTFLFIALLSLTTTIADNPIKLELSSGENNFTILDYFPSIYASQLIRENPSITSITLRDYGQSFGYLNLFGGIGTDFIIEPNKNYIAYTSKNITIALK